jgi:tetratricopeptide (TPR) repeat protein
MDIKNTLKQIATLRETKGKEEETYQLIKDAIKTAKEVSDMESLVKLYWEESLVAQHEAMSEYAKIKVEQDETIIHTALAKMEKAGLSADKIIKENKLENMIGTSHRFLGNIYRYKKDFKRAEEEFIKAFAEYQNNNDKGTLEVGGFIAYCLIQNGDVGNGIKLATETFDDFNNSEKGKTLKEKDYFTWAVWRSGIIPRIVEALIATKTSFDEELITKYLDESEEILRNHEGKITWGDSAFQLRLDEISKSKDSLKNY